MRNSIGTLCPLLANIVGHCIGKERIAQQLTDRTGNCEKIHRLLVLILGLANLTAGAAPSPVITPSTWWVVGSYASYSTADFEANEAIEKPQAKRLLTTVLQRDPNHALAADLNKELSC